MAFSINRWTGIGNLGRDAETKFTPSGVSVTNFSVACTRSWKDQQSDEWKEATTWVNIVLWRKENLANHLVKGTKVYVEGRLETRSYEDKNGEKKYITEIVADEVILMGKNSGGGDDAQAPRQQQPRAASSGNGSRQPQRGAATAVDDNDNLGITDDDVPF